MISKAVVHGWNLLTVTKIRPRTRVCRGNYV